MHYLVLAGAEAEVSFAWGEAARLYARAHALLTEARGASLADDEADLLAALGRCAMNDGQFRDGWRAIMRALDLYRARGDGVGFACSVLHLAAGAVPGARLARICEEALELLGDHDEALWAAVVARLTSPFFTERFATGASVQERRERALAIAERLQLHAVEAELLVNSAARAGV